MIINPKLVLFNGPRHSGKDTAALHCEKVYFAHHFKMSRPLKDGIKSMFNLSTEDVDHLESIKTKPSELLFGKSYVDTQISLSEDWFKPQWGQDVFGRIVVNGLHAAIKRNPEQYLYVCSDSGFAAEATPVVDFFGAENVLLIRISRPSKDFTGDSRSYINLPGVTTLEVSNDSDEESYLRTVEAVVDWFMFSPNPSHRLPLSVKLI